MREIRLVLVSILAGMVMATIGNILYARIVMRQLITVITAQHHGWFIMRHKCAIAILEVTAISEGVILAMYSVADIILEAIMLTVMCVDTTVATIIGAEDKYETVVKQRWLM